MYRYALCCLLGMLVGALGVQQKVEKPYEEHPLCYDSKTQDAWIAYKRGEIRCFMEHKEYPHKSKGYNIDYGSN